MKTSSDHGKIQWCDLTVPDADQVKTFYEAVVGWKGEATPVKDYHDWTMFPVDSDGNQDGSPVSGICHQKGPNKDLPSVWMVYVTVDNLDEAIEAVKKNGGSVMSEHESVSVAVVKDPAGAVFALYQK